MAARRSAIMTSAREMLAEKNLADISLRELSDRVGLAKSNVLRYFDSREAIFLEVLDEEFQAWLTDLDDPARQAAGQESRLCHRDSGGHGDRPTRWWTARAAVRAARVDGRGAGAQHLRRVRPRLQGACDGEIAAVAQLVARHLPWLPREFTEFFAEGALTLTAGMYPFSVPTEPVRAAMAEMGFPDPRERFGDGLRIGLVTWLIGAAAQTEA